MKQETIDHVASLGFDVYMRDPKDTWLIFVEGDKLGNLQEARFGGFDLSTVHKPNTRCGTGYRVADSIPLPDAETLRKAFWNAPDWAWIKDVVLVEKYKGIEAYRKANRFNEAYQLVAKAKSTIAP